MKKSNYIIILIAVFEISALMLNAQSQSTFTVIKVSGAIYSSTLERALTSGDVIAPTDKLKFNSKASYMHVVNASGSLKTVKDIPDDSPRELMGLLQTFVNNKSAKSSRGAPNNTIEIIRHQLAYPTMLILGDGRISIADEALPLMSPSGVKASYTLNGNKVDQVISDKGGFNLGKSFVFKSIGDKKIPEVTIAYYEDVNDRLFSSVELLGEFTPFYTDEDTLIKELKVLIGILQIAGGDAKSIESNVVTYLSSEYEVPVLPNLRGWLQAHKLLTY